MSYCASKPRDENSDRLGELRLTGPSPLHLRKDDVTDWRSLKIELVTARVQAVRPKGQAVTLDGAAAGGLSADAPGAALRPAKTVVVE